MVEVYREWKPQAEAWALIEACLTILDNDLAGYRVTLRQLYYQLVSRNLLPNTKPAYDKLSRVLTNARLAGLFPWDRIEDRVRKPQKHSEFVGLAELIDAAVEAYRLDRWAGQRFYAELWVEKDALASVLKPLADEDHVTLMVNRGYSSITAMKDAADRMAGRRNPILFYLGDLDPSGEDMVRDIRDRLHMFGVPVFVHNIALTPEQVEQYAPPPNPAKLTDTRAKKYVEEHGASSWEVDALHPSVLAELIRGAFDKIIDREKMGAIMDREQADIAKLRQSHRGVGR